MTALQDKHEKEIKHILAKYPTDEKRSAVMPLLYIAQRKAGYVTKQDMLEIAELLSISTTEVASIVGFYTLYHDKSGGKYRIQVCNDLPCALRGSGQFLEELCENLGVQVGETSSDGILSVEAVMCLAACDKAPMFQVQSHSDISYHENQTVESALQTIEKWRAEETDK
ncbi:MAG: NAD(P)H-dependent oxidoreductase subunit E [Chloroflexi bacterium]|nr:NAD(P)H-dependent oxidoreductase subunit E [Chloroflexota bacterium]